MPLHPTRPAPAGRRTPRGIALPVVIFLLVITSLLLAAAMRLSTQASQAGVLELRGVRALAAARAGTEWAAWLMSDPLGTEETSATALPACRSNTTLALPAPLDEFNVLVQCTRHPATGDMDEGGLKLASYQLIATASVGDVDSAERVERRIEVRVTACKNPGGTAPRYAC